MRKSPLIPLIKPTVPDAVLGGIDLDDAIAEAKRQSARFRVLFAYYRLKLRLGLGR